MPSTTQLDFTDRLLADDEQVLPEILCAFGPAVLAVLSRKYEGVLRTHDLEDLLSIGLYSLWVNRSRFEPSRGSLRGWFFQIVDNAARDVLRHGWLKARRMEVSWTSAGPDSAATDVHSGNGHAAPATSRPLTPLQREIREIVAGLPETQQVILRADARSPDGVASAQTLAEELNMSASTIRVYRKRALDRIRSELERRGYSWDT